MNKFIDITARDGFQYGINIAHILYVRKTEAGIHITLINGEAFYSQTTYDDFLREYGESRISGFSDPNKPVIV